MSMMRVRRWVAIAIVAVWVLPPVVAQDRQATGADGSDAPAAVVSAADAQAVESVLAAIHRSQAHIEYLEDRRSEVVGDDVDLLRELLSRRRAELRDGIRALVVLVTSASASGPQADAAREAARALLAADQQALRAEADDRQRAIRDLRARVAEAEPGQRLRLEERLARDNLAVDRMLAAFAANVDLEQQLGVDPGEDLAQLDRLLSRRAEAVGGRMELSLERATKVRQALRNAEPDEASRLRTELRALQVRLRNGVASLQATVALMEARGLPTTVYRQLLLRATGDITAGGFDLDVFGLMLRGWWSAARAWFAGDGSSLLVKLAVFAFILLVARLAASLVRGGVRRAVNRSKVEISVLLRNFLVATTGGAVLLLGFLVGLAQLGVRIGPMLAGLGVAGFIVGFALQESLSNFAAGMMILVYRPFDVGDVIETNGVLGTVSTMSLVSTSIMSFDNQRLVVPNRKIWGDVIRNITAERTRRVDLVFRVGYGDDLERVERVLEESVAAHPRVLPDPAPLVRLSTLSEFSVEYIVRPWVNTEDYWNVYWDLTREVKRRFDREGITIPLPQRVVHVKHDAVALQRGEENG